jgi:hypothetical protein
MGCHADKHNEQARCKVLRHALQTSLDVIDTAAPTITRTTAAMA